MIKKVVVKGTCGDYRLKNADLNYWLSKSTKERIEAVEILRKEYHGNTKRLQRIIRVVEQT